MPGDALYLLRVIRPWKVCNRLPKCPLPPSSPSFCHPLPISWQHASPATLSTAHAVDEESRSSVRSPIVLLTSNPLRRVGTIRTYRSGRPRSHTSMTSCVLDLVDYRS
ncbi:hypothetical protein HGRIS_001261 [Hohenbuehelia grisea]|uniref:Uncharacterized protein n=1 Tax=Hohenbuehelia grisea TaxID=104357 RepID=A0ABR3JNW4_9AGAR